MKISFKEALANLQASLGFKPAETVATQNATQTTEPPATTAPVTETNANDERVAALEAQLKAQNQAFSDFLGAMGEQVTESEMLKTQLAAAQEKIKSLEKQEAAPGTVAIDANADPLTNTQGAKREPTKFELETQTLIEATTYADTQIELYKKAGIL